MNNILEYLKKNGYKIKKMNKFYIINDGFKPYTKEDLQELYNKIKK